MFEKMSDKTLRAFHGDPHIKAKYVARVKAHQLADEITQGFYWENGKGCAVGCTIHSNVHNRYEVELGIPEWLARLEDGIFEGLPNEQAKLFPLRFLEAIPVGADLEGVYYQICHWLLVDPEHGVLRLVPREEEPDVHNAIVLVASLHERAINGDFPEAAEWDVARATVSAAQAWDVAWDVARDAAWVAAGEAARAAAGVAGRAAAWTAGWDAVRDAAGDAAGDAVRAAAWTAAGEAARAAQAEALIDILAAAPVQGTTP